jgi:uncharacterized protein YjiS (DUF1127 family)
MTTSRITANHSLAGNGYVCRPVRRGLLTAVWHTLLCWQSRAGERAHLAAMEPHMRRDIGLSDAIVAEEVRKPFWQP